MNPTLAHAPALAAGRRRWIALVVVCLGQLMMVLDTTIVNVALPAIQRDLRFTPAGLTWVVDAYLVAFGGFLLLAGRAGDLVGRRKVFLAGVALFTAASALCGLARTEEMLVAARFLQGLGGGLSSAVIIALIVTGFPRPDERATAMSVFTFVVSSGGSIGLLAGGLVSQWIGWHWIFFINLPIGLLTFALAALLVTENEGAGLRGGVDAPGAALITAAPMLGVYAIVRIGEAGWSGPAVGAGGLALALLAILAAVEARAANPIVPLRVLRVRGLVGWSLVRAALGTGMFTAFVLGALYLQRVLGFGAIDTGLAFIPTTVAIGGLSLGVTARLMRRHGPRRLLGPGVAACVAGLVLLAGAGVHVAYFPTLFLAMALFGLGAGTALLPLLTLATAEVPAADAGLASAIVNVTLQVAAAVGLAALGSVAAERSRALAAQGQSLTGALTGGYHLAFEIAAAGLAVGLVVALVTTRPRRDSARAAGGAGGAASGREEAA